MNARLSAPFLLALLACLAACTGQPERQQSAASASSSSGGEPPEASAPADIPLGGNLGGADDAVWLSYQCHDGLALAARYYRDGEQAPSAQIRIDGQTLSLPYSNELSNDDLTAFGNGTYTWTISNQYQTDFYKEDNGFLVRHEEQQVNGETLPVDSIVMKNCMPA